MWQQCSAAEVATWTGAESAAECFKCQHTKYKRAKVQQRLCQDNAHYALDVAVLCDMLKML